MRGSSERCRCGHSFLESCALTRIPCICMWRVWHVVLAAWRTVKAPCSAARAAGRLTIVRCGVRCRTGHDAEGQQHHCDPPGRSHPVC